MNDCTPLSAVAGWPRRHQKVDFDAAPEHANCSFNSDAVLAAPTAEAANRWGSDLGPFYPTALDFEFSNSDRHLWLRPRDALPLSTRLSKWALQAAVVANGGALVALAFTIQSAVEGSEAGAGAAIVLGLGLLTAAISLLAYLKFQFAEALWPARAKNRCATSFWLAALSGAGSYAALCLAAFWLLPAV